MSGLSISGNLSGIIEASAHHSAIQALDMLRSSDAAYCVITDACGPLSLATAADLMALEATAPAGLSDLAARLPELVVVQDKPETLSPREVRVLARLISGRGIGAVLVDDGARPVGALPKDSIGAAIDLADLRISGRRWGPPRIPALEFVCRKCVPPTYRMPRSAESEAPVCRRSYFHGPMELLGDEDHG
ncbi:hypothetical protein [Acrocarpospora sp. B8E8]|uniref:hypothetical protein n=1 Tax=Acrocarpospora sp. B8E8 TaxID=3153572 RepID=UPI00325F32AC